MAIDRAKIITAFFQLYLERYIDNQIPKTIKTIKVIVEISPILPPKILLENENTINDSSNNTTNIYATIIKLLAK